MAVAVPKKRIGEMLLEAGIIDETQLKAALGHQRQWGVRLGQALVDLKLATEADIVRALSLKFGFEVAKIETLEPYAHEQALKLFPRDFAIRNNVFPMWADTANVTVAMSDPTNLAVVDEIRFRTGRRVKVCIGGDHEIAEAVKRNYQAEGAVEAIALDLDADAGVAAEAVFDPFGGGSKDALEAFFGGTSDVQLAPEPAPVAAQAAPPAPTQPSPPVAPRPAPVQARAGTPLPAQAAPAAAEPRAAAAPAPSPAPQRGPAAGAPAVAPRPAAARTGVALPAQPTPASVSGGPAGGAQRPAAPPPGQGASPQPQRQAPAAARTAAALPAQAAPAATPPAAPVRPAAAGFAPAAAPARPPAGVAELELEEQTGDHGGVDPEELTPIEETTGETVLATDLGPPLDEAEAAATLRRELTPREVAILESLERLASGGQAQPDVLKPTQAMAALIRLLIRKGVVTELEFLDELARK